MTRALALSLCLALAPFAVGCASAPAAGATGATSSPAVASPEQACLELANRAPSGKSAAPDKITVRHVLVKHAGAKNPRERVTRTRGEACLRAAEARDKVLAGLSFDEAVGAYSDEPGAASRAGSIGEVTRSEVDPAFGAAAFDLDRGQMSDVVESPSGFHLILRAE